MWRQPPLGEVGGAKLWSHFTELGWTGQEAGKNQAILTKCRNATCHQRAGPTTEFKGVSYLQCHGPIVYAVRIVQLSILKVICGKLTKICLLKVAKFYSRLYSKRHKLTAGRTNVCEPLSALRSFIFARWSSVTSKLGKFINSKALFATLSTDVANWSFIYKNVEAVKGCFLCDCDTTQMLTLN